MIITLAWRNLWRNKRRTLITVASVFFAVILSIITISMNQGSYERMIDSFVKFSTGYIQIQDVLYDDEPSIDNTLLFDENLAALLGDFKSEIDYYVPRLQNFALVSTTEKTKGTLIIGIDPELENRFNNLTDNITEGEYLEANDEAVVLSEGLAEILRMKTGDTLVLIGLGFQGTNAAGKFPVKGIVKLRVPEMNNNTVYMPLKAAQWFYLADNRLTSLILMPSNPNKTNQLAAGLNEKIDKDWLRVLTWEEMLADLLNLMKFDMAGNSIILSILYLVIAFGIFGTILTMVMERIKEFGMLISLGMRRFQLGLICFFESIFISMIGIATGTAAAFPIVYYFYNNPVQLKDEIAQVMIDYGFEPVMPFSIDPAIFTSQAQIVLIISFFIGLYPIYKVYRLNVTRVSKL